MSWTLHNRSPVDERLTTDHLTVANTLGGDRIRHLIGLSSSPNLHMVSTTGRTSGTSNVASAIPGTGRGFAVVVDAPVSESLPEMAAAAIEERLGAANAVEVRVVWEPPWSPAMMREDAAGVLGFRVR